MYPVRYTVGERVIIGEKGMRAIIAGNKSIKVYPDSRYVDMARAIAEKGTVGVVLHTHPPGYEITVNFDGQSLHMKDNWVERAPAPHAAPERGDTDPAPW